MSTVHFNVPIPKNEPVLQYKKGSRERSALEDALRELKNKTIDVPMVIDGKPVFTEKKIKISPPHEHQHVLGHYNEGDESHVTLAIEAAAKAKASWENMSWYQRAAIFLKAADLISGPYRAKINAATMLGQSKNAYQAEIDSACEMIDFLRFNVKFAEDIYAIQPESAPGMWNRLEYRALEGFVFALTPFNFTAIAGNLPAAPALMGNTVVWKPAFSQVYSAHVLMEIFMEAGLPAGVINLVLVDGPTAGKIIFAHKDFAGIHFTGSTKVFQEIWKTIGQNIQTYKSYPRIVGETGGKDFVLAHPSALAEEVATGLVRGAFEYQGQKCSAASRAYLPASLWPEIQDKLLNDLKEIKTGSPEDFSNFVNAVIDERSFDKIAKYIEASKQDPTCEIIAGGTYDKSIGYFISPTVILTEDPRHVLLCEEIFGPVLTIYVYEDAKFEEITCLIDETSTYALTGAVFSLDKDAIVFAEQTLKNAAGNFYINDKPTGAVVGQQPFGGARRSGTNDKAGSLLNLLRWVSPRTIKETFVPAKDYKYPFLDI
ncbi:MAG TPA: L-glutamate gamma-semialdehyde dehydrogenase [Cytophagaceae bacterium]|jgi:1-pyrroline-5-carboxylate dehydrogenase